MNGRPMRRWTGILRWVALAALALFILVLLADLLIPAALRSEPLVWLQSQFDREATERAIQSVLDDQVEAWNRGDLEAFMEGYWNSDELTFVSGKDVTRGWKPTLERYQKRYQAEGKEMGKLSFCDLEIKPLAEDSARVRGHWRLVLEKGPPIGGSFLLRFERKPEGWRIVYDSTTKDY